MRKLSTLTAATVLLAGVSLAWADDGTSVESQCQDQAAKDRVTSDKLKAYLDTCIRKHRGTDSGQNSGGGGTASPGMDRDDTPRGTNAPGMGGAGDGAGGSSGTGSPGGGR